MMNKYFEDRCTCSWNPGKLFQNLNACKAIYEFDKKNTKKKHSMILQSV